MATNRLSGLASTLIGAGALLCITEASAAIIYESATLGPTGVSGPAPLLHANQFLGARFHIDSTVDVTGIGGHFLGNGDGVTVPIGVHFGAIVSLTGPSALPSGSPFDGTTLASTTFTPTVPSSDLLFPIFVTLTPGDYAVVFGKGLFGSPADGLDGQMPDNNLDTPAASYIIWNGALNSWFDSGNDEHLRFVVAGRVRAVPEPGTLGLLCFGLLAAASFGGAGGGRQTGTQRR